MTENIGSVKPLNILLRQRLEWIENRLMENAEKNGYGHITPAMARFYSYLSNEPIPMSEIARRLKISRQAVHQLVNEGVQSNFLDVTDSTENKRIKLVRLSTEGKKMASSALTEIYQAEQELIQCLGEQKVKKLRQILEEDWPI